MVETANARLAANSYSRKNPLDISNSLIKQQQQLKDMLEAAQ